MELELEVDVCDIKKVPEGCIVLDIDPEDIEVKMDEATKNNPKTIIINGTPGLNENKNFVAGTKKLIMLNREYKIKNPKTVFIGLGGDGVAAILETLGEKEAKRIFNLVSSMGGSALKCLGHERLSALDKIWDKSGKVRAIPEEKNGMIDYSYLSTVEDVSDNFWKGKKVLLIADMNLGKTPIDIKRSKRITRTNVLVKAIKYLRERKVGKIIIISHFGGTKDYYKEFKGDVPDGTVDPDYSAEPMAKLITDALKEKGILNDSEKVSFIPDSIGPICSSGIEQMKNGDIVILENPRFYKDETSKDESVALEHAKKVYEAIGGVDACVFAAGGASHRGKQGTRGQILEFVHGPRVISLEVEEELSNLYQLGTNPEKPLLAIFQGAKPKDKLKIMKVFIKNGIADTIVVFGKMALPFVNEEENAIEILKLARACDVKIILPDRAIIAKIPKEMNEIQFISLLKKSGR